MESDFSPEKSLFFHRTLKNFTVDEQAISCLSFVDRLTKLKYFYQQQQRKQNNNNNSI